MVFLEYWRADLMSKLPMDLPRGEAALSQGQILETDYRFDVPREPGRVRFDAAAARRS
jgi:hypothetical protein